MPFGATWIAPLGTFKGGRHTLDNGYLILDNVQPFQEQEITDRAAEHIHEHFIDGSDPGLCVVAADSSSVGSFIDFGRLACTHIVSKKEAMKAFNGAHLSGHGGT